MEYAVFAAGAFRTGTELEALKNPPCGNRQLGGVARRHPTVLTASGNMVEKVS